MDGAQRNLPEEFVTRLNELGFALVEADDAYTFVRLNMTGEIRIRIRMPFWVGPTPAISCEAVPAVS